MPESIPETVVDRDKKVFTDEELTKVINGAREAVKSQLNPLIEKVTARAENAEKELTATKAKLSELSTKIETFNKDGKDVSVETENQLKELTKKLEDQKKEYESSLKAVSEEATEQIMRSELKAFKAEQLKESGLKSQFMRLVSGNTNDEILASIKSAKEEQAKFVEEVEKEVAKKIKAELPTPLAPPSENDEPYEDPQVKKVKEFQNLGKMDRETYEKTRAELLKKAASRQRK